jgi:hypothetical protein
VARLGKLGFDAIVAGTELGLVAALSAEMGIPSCVVSQHRVSKLPRHYFHPPTIFDGTASSLAIFARHDSHAALKGACPR